MLHFNKTAHTTTELGYKNIPYLEIQLYFHYSF